MHVLFACARANVYVVFKEGKKHKLECHSAAVVKEDGSLEKLLLVLQILLHGILLGVLATHDFFALHLAIEQQ